MNSRQVVLGIIGLGLILCALYVRIKVESDYDAIDQNERLRVLNGQIRFAREQQERDQQWATISKDVRTYNEGLMREQKLNYDLQRIREGYKP